MPLKALMATSRGPGAHHALARGSQTCQLRCLLLWVEEPVIKVAGIYWNDRAPVLSAVAGRARQVLRLLTEFRL